MIKIYKPTLLVDKDRCLNNIRRMRKKADTCNVKLRPHFKTHQSITIGEWFRSEGVETITVSSVDMALYFANAGWSDILIAFPCSYTDAARLNNLASRISLTILVENKETVQELGKVISSPVNVLVEINTGSDRTGVDYKNYNEIDAILSSVQSQDYLLFKGFYSHAGKSYTSKTKQAVINIHNDNRNQLSDLKQRFSFKADDLSIYLGDTPSCSIATIFEGVDVITPGNFVFYDLMQQRIGACEEGDIATALACPVVSRNKDRLEIVVHGGAVHLSKDFILHDDGSMVFGQLAWISDNGRWETVKGCFVKALSQEHGVIKVTGAIFESIDVGDIVGVLPVHSCLAADVMGGYRCLADGNVEVDHLKRASV